MKVSENERLVLWAMGLDYDAPVATLSAATGLKEHVVQYQLKRLRARGIVRSVPFINVQRIGYTRFEVFFSLHAKKHSAAEALLKLLRSSPEVAWYAELGGAFQYTMTVCAQNIKQVSDFLDLLGARFGNAIHRKSIATQVFYACFTRAYLVSAPKKPKQALSIGHTAETVTIDTLDAEILASLSDSMPSSNRDLSRRLGTPRSTIEYRLKKLRGSGVYLGNITSVDLVAIGVQSFKLLVYVSGLKKGLRAELYRFCAEHRFVTSFSYSLGEWDFEINVEIEESRELLEITRALYSAFSDEIREIQPLAILDKSYSSNYLRHAGRGSS